MEEIQNEKQLIHWTEKFISTHEKGKCSYYRITFTDEGCAER